jgi:hypothetical protein
MRLGVRNECQYSLLCFTRGIFTPRVCLHVKERSRARGLTAEMLHNKILRGETWHTI